eukprot:gene46176-43276_t
MLHASAERDTVEAKLDAYVAQYGLDTNTPHLCGTDGALRALSTADLRHVMNGAMSEVRNADAVVMSRQKTKSGTLAGTWGGGGGGETAPSEADPFAPKKEEGDKEAAAEEEEDVDPFAPKKPSSDVKKEKPKTLAQAAAKPKRRVWGGRSCRTIADLEGLNSGLKLGAIDSFTKKAMKETLPAVRGGAASTPW